MSEFKIVNETILDYGGKDQLYLMLIRYNQRYSIEVDSRKILIGRQFAHSRKEAEAMFSDIEKKMNTYSDIYSAITTMNLAFSMKEVRPFMFIINLLNTPIEFNSIWKLSRTYGIRTNPRVTDLIFEDKSYNSSIEIIFPGHAIPIGKFVAPDADSMFMFQVNEFFLNKE